MRGTPPTPQRIQLRRGIKGWRLQDVSRALNGLPAIAVPRPTKWGNPYRPASAYQDDYCRFPEVTVEDCVRMYREVCEQRLASPAYGPSFRAALDELRGKNLACWCKPGAPCHADVLLELANR